MLCEGASKDGEERALAGRVRGRDALAPNKALVPKREGAWRR